MDNRRLVTLVFTDVEGSTRLLAALGDAFLQVLERQRAILHAAAHAHHGTGYATGGDGCVFVFDSTSDALGAAVDAQRALAAEPWPGDVEVRVRMAALRNVPVLVDGLLKLGRVWAPTSKPFGQGLFGQR